MCCGVVRSAGPQPVGPVAHHRPDVAGTPPSSWSPATWRRPRCVFTAARVMSSARGARVARRKRVPVTHERGQWRRPRIRAARSLLINSHARSPGSRWPVRSSCCVSDVCARLACAQDARQYLFGWCANPACQGRAHVAADAVKVCSNAACGVAPGHVVLTEGCISNPETTSWRDLVPKTSAAAAGKRRLGDTPGLSAVMGFCAISLQAAAACPVVLRVRPSPPSLASVSSLCLRSVSVVPPLCLRPCLRFVSALSPASVSPSVSALSPKTGHTTGHTTPSAPDRCAQCGLCDNPVCFRKGPYRFCKAGRKCTLRS